MVPHPGQEPHLQELAEENARSVLLMEAMRSWEAAEMELQTDIKELREALDASGDGGFTSFPNRCLSLAAIPGLIPFPPLCVMNPFSSKVQ